jgi:putative component of membrane protein insertase Oxa1/YidC/SpoIIIJ protein YidD
MKTAFIILAIFLLGLAGPVLGQSDPMKGPWDNREASSFQTLEKRGFSNSGIFLVSLYQKYISPIDGSDCPMYPSDSRYAIACFQKHGLLMGWIMTVDRLYRCGRNELELSPSVKVNGEPKCLDPVRNNDFWWSHDKE